MSEFMSARLTANKAHPSSPHLDLGQVSMVLLTHPPVLPGASVIRCDAGSNVPVAHVYPHSSPWGGASFNPGMLCILSPMF